MYFDYAATTPPNEEVLKTFNAVNRDFWENPHALHRPGIRMDYGTDPARLDHQVGKAHKVSGGMGN